MLDLIKQEVARRLYPRADQWATLRRIEGVLYELEICEEGLHKEYILGKLDGIRMFYNIRCQVRHDEFKRGYV